jgi:hypothetical protein
MSTTRSGMSLASMLNSDGDLDAMRGMGDGEQSTETPWDNDVDGLYGGIDSPGASSMSVPFDDLDENPSSVPNSVYMSSYPPSEIDDVPQTDASSASHPSVFSIPLSSPVPSEHLSDSSEKSNTSSIWSSASERMKAAIRKGAGRAVSAIMTVGKSLKRRRGELSSGSEGSDADLTDSEEAIRAQHLANKKVKAGPGTSRSSQYARERKQGIDGGTHQIKSKGRNKFLAKCQELDVGARLDDKDPYVVICSRCKEPVRMKEMNRVDRFRTHAGDAEKGIIGTCPKISGIEKGKGITKPNAKKKDTVRSRNILEMFKGAGASSSKPLPTTVNKNVPLQHVPCPGITVAVEPLLPNYLGRTGVPSGGGEDRHDIAKAKFDKPYRELTDEEKEEVVLAQIHTHTWINHHDTGRVFSNECKKFVYIKPSSKSHPVCNNCNEVLHSPRFRSAVNKRPVEAQNLKYTNSRYLNKQVVRIFSKAKGLAELFDAAVSALTFYDTGETECRCQAKKKRSPFLEYANEAVSGRLKNEVFHGLVEAVVTKYDKEKRGKGLQNFKYPPAWDELSHIIDTLSPTAARSLSEFLPMRTHRSFR